MQIPRSFSPPHRGGGFLQRSSRTRCGWIKLLAKTIITGCGSGTQEAGAPEPLWGKGESLHLAGQWFLVVGWLSPVWNHWWLLSSVGRTRGSLGAPAAGYGFTESFWGNCGEFSVAGGGHAERTKRGGPGGASAEITAAFAPAGVEVGSCDGRSRH